MNRNLILFFLLLLYTGFCNAQMILSLNNNWQFKYKDNWYNTTVPNSIHTDLYNHKIIPDPFFSDNEYKLQWIGQQQWEYKCNFNVDDGIMQMEMVELVFEGLDTYCEVFVNDTKILVADNMFREWKVDCKNLLKAENNEIRIVFDATENVSKEKYIAYTAPKLPGEERVMTRKAQYHFGWDFAPRFVTCGIWQDVQLKAWNYFSLNDVSVQTDSIKDDIAYVTGRMNISSTVNADFFFTISEKLSGNKLVYTQTALDSGENNLSFNFSIPHPKLWWCNGEGEQYFYSLVVDGKDTEEHILQSEIKFGIRTVEIVQTPDAEGTSFYFRINGKPVFMKGANYVPQDVFLNRVHDGKYEELLAKVKEAGMNMLRVWGGGVYEKDIFYRLCDEKGIMVWQDFMFACGMYPYDEFFLENVREEANWQVRRLNRFACMALWCGNNESNEGWHRWGWQTDYDSLKRNEIWSGYQKLFTDILPKAVKDNSNIFYWESSPKFGRGDARHTKEGDAHNWFVWHDGEPFDNYVTKVPRFMSEYGFQSLPAIETIKTYCDEKDLSKASSAVKAHQKHARGFAVIDAYMQKEYGKVPQDFAEYVKLSQQMQAMGVVKGLTAHLKSQPRCMGSLIWQLNDCYPAASWSIIDYCGRKKILYDEVKKLLTDFK